MPQTIAVKSTRTPAEIKAQAKYRNKLAMLKRMGEWVSRILPESVGADNLLCPTLFVPDLWLDRTWAECREQKGFECSAPLEEGCTWWCNGCTLHKPSDEGTNPDYDHYWTRDLTNLTVFGQTSCTFYWPHWKGEEDGYAPARTRGVPSSLSSTEASHTDHCITMRNPGGPWPNWPTPFPKDATFHKMETWEIEKWQSYQLTSDALREKIDSGCWHFVVPGINNTYIPKENNTYRPKEACNQTGRWQNSYPLGWWKTEEGLKKVWFRWEETMAMEQQKEKALAEKKALLKNAYGKDEEEEAYKGLGPLTERDARGIKREERRKRELTRLREKEMKAWRKVLQKTEMEEQYYLNAFRLEADLPRNSKGFLEYDPIRYNVRVEEEDHPEFKTWATVRQLQLDYERGKWHDEAPQTELSILITLLIAATALAIPADVLKNVYNV